MTEREYRLTRKNLIHWSKFIAKLKAKKSPTEEELEAVEMRMAQCKIWAYQLKNSPNKFEDVDPQSGDMSASSSVASAESAGANA